MQHHRSLQKLIKIKKFPKIALRQEIIALVGRLGERRFFMAETKKAQRKKTDCIVSGYRKLAFGKVNDAVRLMFPEGLTQDEIKKLDLASVAELKQTKDGLEIKFYDRMKALECLKTLEENADEKSPLYRALIESVAKPGGPPDDGN